MGYLQIDAHLDAGVDIGGELQTNCNGLVRAEELPNLSADNMAIIGIRGTINVREWWDAVRERGIPVYPMHVVRERGFDAVVTEALDRVWNGVDGVYVDVRHRLDRLRLRAGDDRSRAGRIHGRGDHPPWQAGRRARAERDRQRRAVPGLRSERRHRAPRLGGALADALRPRSIPSRRMKVIRSLGAPPSPARVEPPTPPPLRVAAVQQRWHPDPAEHRAALAPGVRPPPPRAPARLPAGAHPLAVLRDHRRTARRPAGRRPRTLPGGPTARSPRRSPREHGCARARLAVRARRRRRARLQHRDLRRPRRRARRPHPQAPHPGHRGLLRGPLLPPAATTATRSRRRLGDAQLGFPTCWDQWFPELARAYSLAGAEVLVYPTAIGSEPDHPDFDTEPLWERVITANGIANGTVHGRLNRIGDEGRCASTARRSSATPTAACSSRRRATSPPCSSPTSTSTSAATGSTSSRSSTRRPDAYGSLAAVRATSTAAG